jgi:hypothetical protein
MCTVPGRRSLVLAGLGAFYPHSDFDGIAQACAHQLANGLADAGAKEARPALFRQPREDFLQVVLEAKVQQPIGLIEDQDLERRLRAVHLW